MAEISGYRQIGVRQLPLAALMRSRGDDDRRVPRASRPPWPRTVDGKAPAQEPEPAAAVNEEETDDMDPLAAAVATQLGISLTALWALMRNPQFPQPTSNAGDGVNISWNASPINAFQALVTSAKANGWVVTVAAYPTANWASMAATPIGSSYRPAFADPLFDL